MPVFSSMDISYLQYHFAGNFFYSLYLALSCPKLFVKHWLAYQMLFYMLADDLG